ncbi:MULTISPECIES: ABC transporter substrate-binding protein [Nonomuraea]|uniref:ABC transporter substrate-binding protein n=1 Tax=Nonomuraea ferruginea TaxID=46174 RepID=A0ABT4SYF7_9ACTN|nr:ABC transporter substrate-binding protein [Nonomuraea ferruginea]MDA0642282.1 ABC transporter substrate-binding protein [Nonomuraea ferruginea]
MIHRRSLLTAALLVPLVTACVPGESGTATPASGRLRLDYAYYNPLSLVIRQQRWLEDALPGTEVTWVLSAGSNKANENLRGETIDLGSTAGAAALQARANGTPIKTVGIYTRPEWAALVVAKDSPITEVSGLKGKKVAATKGTDPYFFLLQALEEAGLDGTDVEVVNLQHADGKTALERGDVDAWSGLTR